MDNPKVILKPGRDKPARNRHPWIFDGAIARAESPAPGAAVEVLSTDGAWLGRGLWSSESKLRVRLLIWQEDEPLDESFFRRRLETALAWRRQLGVLGEDAACRLVHAESDGLPGLIVDRYGRYLCVQLLTQGMAGRRELLTALLRELCSPRGILDHSDPAMLQKEGLSPGEVLLDGDAPPERLEVRMAGDMPIGVDLRGGQKTGAYLDQALNRRAVATYCKDADVLDAFCYTGGFSAAAARAGARSITAVDSSAEALALVSDNVALARAGATVDCVCENVFETLRRFRDEARSFDVVVLDPPKFAHNQHQVNKALRGYRDINILGMKLLRPGGMLATFSCSGAVDVQTFRRMVQGASIDAGRTVQVGRWLAQSPDHPMSATFPEGEYLKGALARVL